ncbi:MAG: bifunctional diguanylate cyclase/phosphodiesterase, partial [Actinomycetota bacterium]|nr:bifunctional diguanylate cyclase/phosphodiesterase [Actinomycetota bacterium]
VWLPAVAGVVMAVQACLFAAAGAHGALRKFWRRMAAGMAVNALAGCSQAVDVATAPHGVLSPMSRHTLLTYVAAVLVIALAVLRLPTGSRHWRHRLTEAQDVAIVMVAAAVAAAQYLRSFAGVGSGVPASWLNLGMLAIGAAGLIAVVKSMVAGHGPLARPVLWYGAAAAALGPLSVPMMSVLQPWPHLNGSAVVLPAAGLLFCLAVREQARAAPAPQRSSGTLAKAGVRRDSYVPLVATTLTTGLLLTVYLRTGDLPPILLGGAAVLMTMVVARQAVALSGQAALLGRLAHQASHDTLTGLPNRRAFTAAIEDRVADGEDLTVLLLDINAFGAINDGLGAAAGDALLRAYGERLLATAGAGTLVARLGSDEFGLLAPAGRAGTPAEQVLTAMRLPLEINGHDLLMETAIGVATAAAPQSGDVFRRAEVALRAACAAGGHRLVSYDTLLDQRSGTNARLAAELRRALEGGEFHLLYQPIIDLGSGHVTSVESLIRWQRADGRVVSPADFIPVAEETGLIVELGAWVIDTASAQAADWRDRHGPHAPKVAVNVSARQLLDPALPRTVAAALARHSLPPHRLTVELTETAVFGGGPALATVRALAELGVAIALDDFGTGHSSLSLLRTCPVDVLKVDKSFIDGLNGAPEQEAIAVALSGIATSLHLRTVAEGVETAAQADRLRDLGYHHAQGFHFSRPIPADAVDALLPAAEPAALR